MDAMEEMVQAYRENPCADTLGEMIALQTAEWSPQERQNGELLCEFLGFYLTDSEIAAITTEEWEAAWDACDKAYPRGWLVTDERFRGDESTFFAANEFIEYACEVWPNEPDRDDFEAYSDVVRYKGVRVCERIRR